MNMPLRKALNRNLDKHVRMEVYILRRPWPAFQVWGYTGLALAILLAMTLSIYLGLSPVVIAAITVAAVLTVLTLAMAIKIITGQERHAYYHHAMVIMAAITFLLWLLSQPILPYLDITILGIGLFLAVGRVGCLMVGCCHGRPCQWGVCYRQEHAGAGFTPYYVGVRLFPIQTAESIWVLCIITVGISFILSGQVPGTLLAWYIVSYGLGRFCLEFFRGDPERPYLWRYSEAQWTSLVLMCLVVWAEHSGILPLHIWHAIATASLLLAMIGIAVKRTFRGTTASQLLHPRHVREVAEVIELVTGKATEMAPLDRRAAASEQSQLPTQIHIACTSLGVQLSASKIKDASAQTYHYALSHRDGGMTEETARLLTRLILQLRRAKGSSEFLTGSKDVFHLLIHHKSENRLAH